MTDRIEGSRPGLALAVLEYLYCAMVVVPWNDLVR